MKKNLLRASVAVATLGAGSAMAAVPTEITTAITDSQVDTLAIIGAAGAAGVVAMGAAMLWSMGISLVPKFLKRGANK